MHRLNSSGQRGRPRVYRGLKGMIAFPSRDTKKKEKKSRAKKRKRRNKQRTHAFDGGLKQNNTAQRNMIST
jgi:hypothetical protein